MEVINRLLNYSNLNIVQNTDWFNFSLDSVLLANFVEINKKTKKIIDFCTGNAPIPLILNKKYENCNLDITGIELQPEIFSLAIKSLNINNKNDKIKLYNMDVKELPLKYETDTFDIITCNPPFFKVNSNESKLNDNNVKSIARHEIMLNLNDIFSVARKILKNNGKICIVHRTNRLIEVLQEMKKNNIEPKRIQFVYPKINSDSNIFLIEGTKNGNSGLKIMKPLYIHDKNGNYLDEIRKIFE